MRDLRLLYRQPWSDSDSNGSDAYDIKGRAFPREPPPSPVPLGDQQLQLLCSCCPNLQSLEFTLTSPAGCTHPTALQPLLQLSALTKLTVQTVDYAINDAMGVVAQLTGLKQLLLLGIHPKAYFRYEGDIHQLTALTGLETLCLESDMDVEGPLEYSNKVSVHFRSNCGTICTVLQ
jgi:hypothetical protein